MSRSFFLVMLCQCKCSVTVIMFLQQCVSINVFVTMFLYIICNHMLVTGYVLLVGMTSDFFKLLTLLFFQVQCEELKETIQENFT